MVLGWEVGRQSCSSFVEDLRRQVGKISHELCHVSRKGEAFQVVHSFWTYLSKVFSKDHPVDAKPNVATTEKVVSGTHLGNLQV